MAEKNKGPVESKSGGPITRTTVSGKFDVKKEGSKAGRYVMVRGDPISYAQGSIKTDVVLNKGEGVTLSDVKFVPHKGEARWESPTIKAGFVTTLAAGPVHDLEAFFTANEKEATSAPNPATYRDHDEATAEMLRDDPELAVEMLNAILEDGDQGELLVTLRQIATAKGMADIAKETDLNRSQLYRTLSEAGNPSLNNFIAILKALGMRLAVQPIESVKTVG